MRGRNYEVIKAGVFIGYREDTYARLRLRTDRPGQTPTPKMREMSPYKLHLSLSYHDYMKHQGKITDILLSYLNDQTGALKDFKVIDMNIVNQYVALARELISLLQAFQHHEKSDPDAEKKLEAALTAYYGQSDIPTTEELPTMLKEVEEGLSTNERFQKGEQFTIYLPTDYNEEHFIELCKELMRYFIKHKIEPGEYSDVSSPIGPYFSLRQEYLLEDYNKGKTENYIASLPSLNGSEEALARREKVKVEQESSDFYKKVKVVVEKIIARKLPSQSARLSFSDAKGSEQGKEKEASTPPPSPSSTRKGN